MNIFWNEVYNGKRWWRAQGWENGLTTPMDQLAVDKRNDKYHVTHDDRPIGEDVISTHDTLDAAKVALMIYHSIHGDKEPDDE